MMTSTVYEIDVPGLAVAVSNCLPDESHKALLQCLRSFEQLSSAKLVTSRGGDGSHYLARRKVLTRDGVLVRDDHKEWVAEQLLLDGGDAGHRGVDLPFVHPALVLGAQQVDQVAGGRVVRAGGGDHLDHRGVGVLVRDGGRGSLLGWSETRSV